MEDKIRKYKVYSLKDPDTLQIRYIGVTCTTLSARLSNHLYYARKRNCTHLHNWLASILEKGGKPVMELVEEVPEEKWEEREKYWIAFYKPSGLLTNPKRDGGAGVVVDRTLSARQRSASAKSLPVVQLNMENKFIAEFPSVMAAGKALDTSCTNIGNVLAGRAKTAKKSKWFYKADYEKEGFDAGGYNFNTSDYPRQIKRTNLENGEEVIYQSLTEAASKNNINTSMLCTLIRGNKPICILKFTYI